MEKKRKRNIVCQTQEYGQTVAGDTEARMEATHPAISSEPLIGLLCREKLPTKTWKQASNAAYTILLVVRPQAIAFQSFFLPINFPEFADLVVVRRRVLSTRLKVKLLFVDNLLWDQRLNLWLVVQHQREANRVLDRERRIQVLQETRSVPFDIFQAIY